MNLAEFGVKNPVVANLCMFAMIGAGLIFGLGLQREFFPEVRPNQAVVLAPYPGAAPEDIEESLAVKIEDRVSDLTDVEEINSVVSDGAVSVRVEFKEGVNIDTGVADVQREMDALQDLPEQAEKITVAKLEPNLPVVALSIVGEADERDMKRAIQQVRDDLRDLIGGDLMIGGVRTDEITVEVNPEAALARRLSLPTISDKIRQAMIEVPGGTARSSTLNTTVRTLGAEERAEEIRNIVVKSDGQGVTRVRDIASVTEGFEDVQLTSRLNGEPAVSITVFKKGTQDIVRMSEVVKAYAAGRRGEPLELTISEKLSGLLKPPTDQSPVSKRVEAYELGLSREAAPGEIVITTDLARFVVGRLDLLSRNAFWGGILVFLTLVVLLNWRVSFWVAIGLLISLAGTLTMMYFIGITLNLLTMFGLIIVIGILVDDAIVVAENIVSRHERGETALQAAISGTKQVSWPVTATVLTTVCAFFPLALIDGTIGDFLKVLPMVVGVALLVSLIEALFILPSHMGHTLKRADKRGDKLNAIDRIEQRFDKARDHFFQRILIPAYMRAIAACIRARYFTLACAIALLIGSFGMIAGGRLEFVLFEDSDSETINATVTMPVGTPTAVTDQYVRRIEKAFMAQEETQSAFAQAGAVGDINGEGNDASASHIGQVIVELIPTEQRDRDSSAIIQAVRDQLGDIPEIKSLRIDPVGGGPGGPAITLAVVGDRPGRIDKAVKEIKQIIASYEGVENLSDDSDAGQRELRLSLRDGADELGFTTEWLAQQVRGAVFGLEPHTFPGEREDVDVRVIMPPRVRDSLAAIERMHVFTPDGRPVPLMEVARLEEARSYASIRRLDGKRVVQISADVNRQSGANPEQIAGSVMQEIEGVLANHPGVEIVERGRQKDTTDSLSTLPLGMIVAAGLIYVILTWLFSSYAQPLIVMSAIPFALIGMIWGHLLLGYSMTFLSLIGFIALSGIVVNDSLIFVKFFNEKRSAGWTVPASAMLAGHARMRAILLTTVTTVLGLTPLMLEKSFQAAFLIPMAITISFGLISATGIILIVLPCLLIIMDDAKRVVSTLWTGRLTPRQRGIRSHEPAAE